MPPCAAQGCKSPDDAACAPGCAGGAKALKPMNNVSGAAVAHAAGAPGAAAGAAPPPPPIKLEFPAAEPATKKPKVEAGGAAAAAPPPPAPPPVKLEDDDGHPAVKLEDDDDDSAAAAPALPFVPPPFVPPVFVQPPPAPPPAASRLIGKMLGSNRGNQRAMFQSNASEGISPHVIECKPPPPYLPKIAIHASLSVAFPAFPVPLVPTPPQMQVMTTLAAALVDGKHCIVEAPTGTGKTAAVFMPLLAFQAQQEEMHGASDPSRVPRIVYVARTLAQLDKTGKELATYPYETLMAAPVGKEHLCMLEKEEGVSRADQCRTACKPLSDRERFRTGRETGCQFLDTQNQQQLPNSRIKDYFTGGALAGHTVEDVKKQAAKEGICAYHVSRDLANTEGANVVMLTYNQLLDPLFRVCNKTDALLRNALVFFDEAHNVPDVCRQVSSEALSMGNLLDLRDESCWQEEALHIYMDENVGTLWVRSNGELPECLAPCLPEAIRLSRILTLLNSYFMNWMVEQADLSAAPKRLAPIVGQRLWSNDEGTKQLANLPGTHAQDLIFAALDSCGAMRYALPAAGMDGAAPLHSPAAAAGVGMSVNELRKQRALDACAALKHLAKDLEAIDHALSYANYISPTEFGRRQRTPTSRFATLLSKLEMCVGANADAFALVLRRLSPQGVELERNKLKSQRDKTLPALDIVCLTASLAMEPVLKLAQCVVFASGTLGPPKDFALEVGLHPTATPSVMTDHHASVKTQLLPLVYTGSELRITTKTMGQDQTLDDVGTVLLRCAPNVPGGILVFFCSKNACDVFCKRWKNQRVLQQLQQLLPDPAALVIDTAGTPEEAAENLKRFSDHAINPSISGRPTAIMFSVLRGRSAEGADFKDGLARAVFVVRVPLAPFKDPFVVAKKAYNTRLMRSMYPAITDGGQRWYSAEAARCAAQAAGRVIRHAGDFGVVVLLDSRYTDEANFGSVNRFLPRYLQNLLQFDTDVTALANKVKPFFQRCAALPAPPAPSVKRER